VPGYGTDFAERNDPFYIVTHGDTDYAAAHKKERFINLLARRGIPIYQVYPQLKGNAAGESSKKDAGPGSYIIWAPGHGTRRYVETGLANYGITCSRAKGPLSVRAARVRAPKIAVFNGTGNGLGPLTGFGKCLEALGFRYELIGKEEIIEGKLKGFDIFMMPGGDEPWYGIHLAGEGNECIREYIKEGGSYIGACAGAYYAAKQAVPGSAQNPRSYRLKGQPENTRIGFLNAFDVACTNNIPWEKVQSLIPHSEEFVKHGSREVGFRSCWYSDYLEVAQAYPFKISSTPLIQNVCGDHPVMFGLAESFPLLYAGGPMMRVTGSAAVLGRYKKEIPEGRETFSPEHARNLLLHDSACIVEGKHGKGRGILFSCHPESMEESFMVVGNAVRYSANGSAKPVSLPSKSRKSKAIRPDLWHRSRNSCLRSLLSVKTSIQRAMDINKNLLSRMPAPILDAANDYSSLAEKKTAAIFRNIHEIEESFSVLPGDSRVKFISGSIHLPAVPEKRAERMKELSRTAVERMSAARDAGGKLREPANKDKLALMYARNFFPYIMGKGDLLGAGSAWINRWAPGIESQSSEGVLPVLNEIWELSWEIKEELEFLIIVMR